MTGILDGHNIEIGSTPLDRLEESVATSVEVTTHINDNTDPHGILLRQTAIAINDVARLMSEGSGLKFVDYTATSILRGLLLQDLDVRGTLDVADNFIKVNAQTNTAPTASGGIEVERGTGVNAYIMWDEVNDYWAVADEVVSSTTHRILDQRDRDALDARDNAIETDLHTNYVHKTADIAENITGVKTFTADANFLSDVTITGITKTLKAETLDILDNKLTINTDVTAAPTENASVVVNRGSSADTDITWNEGSDTWTLTDDGSTYNRILDQRDRDALDARDNAIETDLHTNYVHKTGDIAETITGNKTFEDNVTITGNLNVNGTTTTINTAELTVSDNIINLNNDVTGVPTENSGISVVRGTSSNVSMLWNEGSDTWTLTDNGSNYYKIADQRDVDALDTRDNAIETDLHTNYVHKTGSVTETITGVKTFADNTFFSSDVTISGITHLLQAGTLNILDNKFVINSDITGTPAENVSITVNRGSSADTAIVWNEGSDTWTLTDNGSNYYKITDQRDVDAIYAAMTGNYVHRTGSVAESISGAKTFTSAATVNNTLTVTSTTYLQGQVAINDNIIVLNYDVAGAPYGDAGIQIERGTSANVSIVWNEVNDYWTLTNNGSNHYRILTTDDEGSGKGLDADTVDGFHATDIANGAVGQLSNYNNRPVGWYTIAINAGNRAHAHLIVTSESSGLHQSVQLYAGIEYGTGANINVVSNTLHGPICFSQFRIQSGGTYDGAMLQVYVNVATNSTHLSLSNNLTTYGWQLRNFIPAGTDPGGTANYAALTNVTALISSMHSGSNAVFSHDIYSGNGTAQAKVWNALNDGHTSGLDADVLDGFHGSDTAVAHTYALRDSAADISARLFKAGYANDSSIGSTAAVAMRLNNTTDNYTRYITPAGFSSWCQAAAIKTYDSERAGGLLVHTGNNAEPNKVVRTDASGYLNTGWIHTSSGDAGTAAITRVYGSYDGYIRYYTLANFAAQVLAQGSTTNAHTHNFIKVADTRNNNYGPDQYDNSLVPEFKLLTTVNSPSTSGVYCGTLTFAPWSETSGGNGYQLAFTQDNNLSIRTGNLSSTTWGSWAKLWSSANDGHGSGLDADTLDGAQPATSSTGSSIAQRDSSGRLYASEYRTSSAYTRMRTDYGYVDIGPQNTSYAHFLTDRPEFYFNHAIYAVDKLQVYGTSTYLTGTGGYIAGNTIWNAGNDGSGSGLDADLLDGQHASAFAASVHTHPEYSTSNNYIGSSSFSGVAIGTGYKLISPLPAGCPANINQYNVHVTLQAPCTGTVGEVSVSKATSYFGVYRSGSYAGTFHYTVSW